MMKRSTLSVTLLLESVIFLCLLIHTGSAIKCHVCNTVNETRCGDPFDKEKNQDLLIDCSTSENPDHRNASFCRKIDQTVHDEHRVFRMCAWEDHKKYDCYFGTSQYYKGHVCICRTDGCNSASSNKHMWILLFIIITPVAAALKLD